MYLLLITHADDGRVLGSWRALCAYLVHFMRVTLLVSFLYASAFLMGSGMKLRPLLSRRYASAFLMGTADGAFNVLVRVGG